MNLDKVFKTIGEIELKYLEVLDFEDINHGNNLGLSRCIGHIKNKYSVLKLGNRDGYYVLDKFFNIGDFVHTEEEISFKEEEVLSIKSVIDIHNFRFDDNLTLRQNIALIIRNQNKKIINRSIHCSKNIKEQSFKSKGCVRLKTWNDEVVLNKNVFGNKRCRIILGRGDFRNLYFVTGRGNHADSSWLIDKLFANRVNFKYKKIDEKGNRSYKIVFKVGKLFVSGIKITGNNWNFIKQSIKNHNIDYNTLKLINKNSQTVIKVLDISSIRPNGIKIPIMINLIKNKFKVNIFDKEFEIPKIELINIIFYNNNPSSWKRSSESILSDLIRVFNLDKKEVFDNLKKLKMLQELKR